jgi:hypothetical protein
MLFTLDNRTPHSDAEVRELITAGAGAIDLAGVHVIVRSGLSRHGWRGKAFRHLPSGDWPPGTVYLIRISLNRARDYANGDWRMWLVEGVAHEAKHVEQYREGRHHSLGRAMARRLEQESRDYQRLQLGLYLTTL